MKVQDLTLTDELRDIVQIGIITDDIERTKKGMLEVLSLIHILFIGVNATFGKRDRCIFIHRIDIT